MIELRPYILCLSCNNVWHNDLDCTCTCDSEDWISVWPLVLQNRPERQHLYQWINEEEEYVTRKFDDERNGHDDSMKKRDLDGFWIRQVVQYYDRAKMFLLEAAIYRTQGTRDGDEVARKLESRAQQAIAKAMMTAKGMVESSIRVFGPLPKPGVPSGEIKEWV